MRKHRLMHRLCIVRPWHEGLGALKGLYFLRRLLNAAEIFNAIFLEQGDWLHVDR